MTTEEAIKVLKQIRQWTDYPKEALTMAIDALSKSSLPINVDEDKLIESELDKKWLVERDMDGNVINGVSDWKGTGSLMNFPAVFNLAKHFYHLGKQNICIPSDIDEAADALKDLPRWRHAYTTCSEGKGKPTNPESAYLDDDFLIILPQNSNEAKCILLDDLKKLPGFKDI